MPTVYPCVPGHEIVGRVTRAEAPSGSSRRATWRAWAAWSTRAAPAPPAGRGWSSSARAGDVHLQLPRQTSRRRDLRRLLRQPRGRRGLHAARIGPGGPGRHGAAPVRRDHHLFAPSALERRRRTEGRRRGPRRPGAHGREVRPRSSAQGWSCSRRRPARPRTPSGWGRTTWSSPRNAAEMQKNAGSFDFILDTVSATHDLNAYLALLKRDGTLTLVGAPEAPLPVSAFGLIFGRKRLAGSPIGGSPGDPGDAGLRRRARDRV